MRKESYVIEYSLRLSNGSCEAHKTKVKNCFSELQAKVKLGEYLKRKHSNFLSLEISSCRKDILGSLFGDFDSNPFNW